jgi:alpha-amylase
VWIHETLAAGGTVTRHLDDKVIVVNRTGGPGLLTAPNFDTFNRRTITCGTAFGAGVWLHDYTGRHPDVWTDGGGNVTFTVPSNAFQSGQSYLCFSRSGMDRPIVPTPRPTTQVFFGAADLDTPPAVDGRVEVGRIWCAHGRDVDLTFAPDTHAGSFPAGTQISLELLGPTATIIATQNWAGGHPTPGVLHAHPATDGWHTLRLTGTHLPEARVPYELTATYTAATEVPA